MKQFDELRAMVDIIGDDLEKAESGNKAAGTRVRKAMQDIKNKAQEIRQSVLGLRSNPCRQADRRPRR